MTDAVVRGASSDYELLARLAQGGMAEIFLARVRGIVGFERYVVLKRIRSERDDDPLWVQMFLDEARLVAQLTHPNIAQVFDLGEIGDSYFYTMEYVHGEDVLDMLTRTNANGERIPLAVALGIATGAAQGLAYAHERRGADGAPLGIVHRDVSPANLMVSFEGVVKVLDFGVAKARSRSTETEAGTIMGKIAYLSPEQCNTVTVDHRSDQFSLGIVLYEMLTHHRPFKRPTDYDTLAAIVRFDPPPPSSLNRDLPPGLDAVVLRALAKNPRDRFESTHAMIEALEQVADNAGIALAQRDLKKFMRNLYGTPPEPWRTLAVGEDSMGMFQGEVIGPLGPETELRFFPPDANANDVPLLSQSLTPLGTPSYVHPPAREPAPPVTAPHYKPVPRLPTDDLVEAGPTPSWSIPPVARHAVGTEPSGSLIVAAPPVAVRPVTVTPTAGVRVAAAPRRSYRVVAITAALVIGIGVLVVMVMGGRETDGPAPAPAPASAVGPAPSAPAAPVNPGITATPIEEPAPSSNAAKPATSAPSPGSESVAAPASGVGASASSVGAAPPATGTRAGPSGATGATSAPVGATSTASSAPSAVGTAPSAAKSATPSSAPASVQTAKPATSSSAPASAQTAKPATSSSVPASAQTAKPATPSSAPASVPTAAKPTTSSSGTASPSGTATKPADPKKGKTGAKAKPACTDPLDCQF